MVDQKTVVDHKQLKRNQQILQQGSLSFWG